MQVRFFTNSKRHNSTKIPTGGASYTCVLKDQSSKANPIIALKWDGSGDPTSYNQCWIGSYNKYYWIDNWTYADRQWIASCSYDVLATYKQQIAQSSKYVLRAASEKRIHVLDNRYPAIMPPTITKYPVQLQDWPTQSASAYNNGYFVVGIVGQGNSFASGGIVYVQMQRAAFETMISNCFTKSYNEWSAMTGGSDFGNSLKQFGQNLLKSVNNPFDYINSVKWFPFPFSTSGSGTVKLGRIDTEAVAYGLASGLLSTNQIINLTPDPAEFDWEKIEPYTTYNLVIPPFGQFNLDSRKVLAAGGIHIYVWNDAISGMSTLQVAAGTDTIVFSGAQVGVPIQIAGIQADLISSISAGATIAGAAGAAVTGGLTAGIAAAGLSAMASAVGDGWYNTVQSGSPGGLAAVTDDKALYVTKYAHVDMAPDEMGYPICEVLSLGGLSGYIQCADGELDVVASPEEHAQLAAFLTGGFFYE